MNTRQINDFLQKTRETVEYLDHHGKHGLALQVLRTGSVMAEFAITMLHESIIPKLHCSSCGRWIKTGNELEFYRATGECYSCDHLRSDIGCDGCERYVDAISEK